MVWVLRFVCRRSDGAQTTKRGFASERAARDARRRLTEQVERGEVRHTKETFGGYPALERKQVERLRAAKADRDTAAVELALAELKEAAGGGRNLMPPLLDATRVHVSEGEIVQALQQVWGDYREQPVF